jgi:acetyl-CoA decarbonylase/synthase complex subunit gamma
MALSGLDIYKLLPKTNCKECGFATCLAFAMQLAKKAVSVEKCPHIGADAKATLEAQAQPPIKLIAIGAGENRFEVGNESVMFRHEEKFHRPCGLGFIIEDSLTDGDIKTRLSKINSLIFERVGQELKVNLVAVKQTGTETRFLEAVKLVKDNTTLGLVLISSEPDPLVKALQVTAGLSPLVYATVKGGAGKLAKACVDSKASLVAEASDLEGVVKLTAELAGIGAQNLVIHTGKKSITDKLWDLTQIRRLALKKSNRALGYPVLVIPDNSEIYSEAMEAATYIAKYAGIVLLKNIESWEALSLLTLRQNIYTDPQKPLQIEPKLYPVGQVSDKSPVLVTTNFSLSYYTVLGEVEASKVPSYIVSVDTEGMSVLTAWAAEKFTPEKISDTLNKFGVSEAVKHKQLIIPGYVAVMSGDLEEQSGYKIIVGPKEAAGIPSFLKNL